MSSSDFFSFGFGSQLSPATRFTFADWSVRSFQSSSLESLNSYTGSLGTQFSVFDTPLHYNFKEAVSFELDHRDDLRFESSRSDRPLFISIFSVPRESPETDST